MTITSLLLNFRAALVALIPMLERVGLGWKRPEAYDEWDDIASTLFEKLVVEAIEWSLAEDSRETFKLPPYDLLLPTYAALGTLEVAHPSLRQGRWVFHAFGTDSEPFDQIEVRLLSEDGVPLSEGFETCPVDGAGFCLRVEPEAQLIEKLNMTDG